MRMRDRWLCLTAAGLVLTFSGFAAAQTPETNFSTGPQYLITNGSPLFAQPISTPSLSFSSQINQTTEPAEETASDVQTQHIAAAEEKNLLPLDYYPIYYGIPKETESIEDGSTMSFHFTETRSASPAMPLEIFNTGVGLAVTAEELNSAGVGAGVAQVAAAWKSKKTAPVRTYTNQDIDRLKQGS